MKFISRLSMFMLAAILFAACNSDDEDVSPDQQLENASLSFSADQKPIEVPSAISDSDSEQAQLISSYVSLANGMAGIVANLEVPSGAQKSSDPIGGRSASNGRTNNDVLVYTWTATGPDGSSISVAYQISETSSRYIFEMFWKWNDGDFIKYLHAEESKTEREGFLEFYNITANSTGGEDYFYRYSWNEDADGTFHFDLETPDNEFAINITVNPDNSGSIDYYLDGGIWYELTWNSAGTGGTYVYYNSNGGVEESGDWSS